jgi:hypothetical protein
MRHGMLVLALSACGGPSGPPPGAGPPVELVGVREVGVVRNPGLAGVVRDGGAGGRVGGKVLWTFRDTTFPFVAEDGATFRSSTGAYAEVDAPTTLSEPLDDRGAPFELLPLDEQERAYNAAGGLTDRYALWPTAVLPQGENAMILYARMKVTGDEATPLSTGFALVHPFVTVATRFPEVFTATDPPFHHAAALDAGDLYLYACGAGGMCRVARAPYADAVDRAAYRFWTGSSWSVDAAAAAPVVPGSATGFSVSYNTYVERFVSVTSPPASGRIVLRVSARPEGPWSAEVLLVELGTAVTGTVLHPVLFSEAGRRMYFSTFRPGAATLGEVRLYEIELR